MSWKIGKVEVPPPLPSRKQTKDKHVYTPSPTVTDQSSLKSPGSYCSKCDASETECSHCYEELPFTSGINGDMEQNQYEKLIMPKVMADVLPRLRMIEDNQTRLRNEINELRDDITRDLRSLHTSMKHVQEIVNSVEDFMHESLNGLRESMSKVNTNILENSDHLGKQILDVRRDILNVAKNQPTTFNPYALALERTLTHSFEWEVGKLDSMMKHQKKVSSQSYLISQLNFKVLGEAVCKDGHFCVKITGDFTRKPSYPPGKSGKFNCSLYMIDKSGRQDDWLLFKVNGDFYKEKEWPMCQILPSHVKEKGFTSQNGVVTLKFVIEIFA